MPALLFLALAGVYVLGVLGIVAVGSMLGSEPQRHAPLEVRLAAVREAAPVGHLAPDERSTADYAWLPYFVRRRMTRDR